MVEHYEDNLLYSQMAISNGIDFLIWIGHKTKEKNCMWINFRYDEYV